ncbi:ATP-binding protein [Rubrivirga sp.]|uniref:ATP-binding protein n=1 Tax=Rubrivirga sp. TaxID=1885344 RepID=UPI003C788D6B
MSRVRPHTAEITRPGALEHLPALLACLDEAAAAAGVGDDVLFPVHLAAEEACTNVITHGYTDEPGPLTLRFEATPRRVAVTLTDEAPPFDPAAAPPPPLDGEDRLIGGLGWHLIRETMDEVRHETGPAGGNRLTLIKHLP